MDLNFITANEIAEFERQFPTAAAFLRKRSLWGEYRHLSANKHILNDWQKGRLNELVNWQKSRLNSVATKQLQHQRNSYETDDDATNNYRKGQDHDERNRSEDLGQWR